MLSSRLKQKLIGAWPRTWKRGFNTTAMPPISGATRETSPAVNGARSPLFKFSSVALWRLACVVFASLILAQAWFPRPLTAQSPIESGANRPNSNRFRETAAKRQQETRNNDSNFRSHAANRPPITKGGQLRPIADSDQASEPEDNAEPTRMVQPNRVAPAQLRQEQGPAAGNRGPFPDLPQFQLDQFVNTDQLVSPQGLKSSLGVGFAVTILSLAPAILMMSTCFVRFIVVLSLLRQALGTPNLPPNQVLMGLSLCLTFLVMAPVWNESYQQGVRPYVEATSEAARPNLTDVFDKTVGPIRRFMSHQIEKSNNADAVWMFVEYQRPAKDTYAAETWEEPETYDDVSLTVLLPAYLLSELKTAFLIGFQIYLPFLIIDLVVASVLMSMGLPMLSPTQVSLPFKLLLFVLIDGWTLTVGMLIESVRLAA